MTNLNIHENLGATGYVTQHAESLYDGRNGPEIDLGLASSPIGPAPELRELLRTQDPFDLISHYPKDPLHKQTRELLIHGIGLNGIGYESVVLDGNGSYGAGDEITRYLTLNGYHTILAQQYSFPNVAQWAVRHGMRYSPMILGHPFDHTQGATEILTMTAEPRIMSDIPGDVKDGLKDKVVYIDYPNNPTGNAYPDIMRAVVRHSQQHGAVPLVDFAFGEVLGDEFRDAMQYVLDHDGIAIGSLSKTQGVAGLRTGYAILPEKFTHNGYSGDQRLVFGLNSLSEYTYQQLFNNLDENGRSLAYRHAQNVANYNQQTNTELITRLTNLGLQVAPTDLRTPIQVIVSSGPEFYQALAHQGVKTESLEDYSVTVPGPGLGHSAVRMLTPAPGQLNEVLRRVELAIT